MFGKLLFFFVLPKLGISYKAKKAPQRCYVTLLLYAVVYNGKFLKITIKTFYWHNKIELTITRKE